MSDFPDAIKNRTAKEFLNSTKNLATWLTRRDVLTKQTINPDTLISWVRGYVNDLECDCKYHEEQNKKLKSQIDNNPTSTILNLQETIKNYESYIAEMKDNYRFLKENITRTEQPQDVEVTTDELMDLIDDLIDRYCEKDIKQTNLQESNTRFEKQVSDLTAEKLRLQNENKQLQNINTGLHLLINKQDEAEKDKEEIAKCQAVVDAANELREYLENK